MVTDERLRTIVIRASLCGAAVSALVLAAVAACSLPLPVCFVALAGFAVTAALVLKPLKPLLVSALDECMAALAQASREGKEAARRIAELEQQAAEREDAAAAQGRQIAELEAHLAELEAVRNEGASACAASDGAPSGRNRVEPASAPASASGDIAYSRPLGEWVQRYLVRVERQGDLYGIASAAELCAALEELGVHVYRDIEVDAAGAPVLPPYDYFADRREGSAFTRVTRPVVYSDRQLLARGELR